MSDDTDFVALYEELGLDAECNMIHFKRAYRRRVAQLHPDHPGAGTDMPRLQRLNRLYEAALEFHRVHGRLPGAGRTAPAVAPRTATTTTARAAAPAPVWNAANDDDAEVPLAGSRPRRRYLLWLALLGVLLVYGWGVQRNGSPTLDPAGPGDAVAPGLPMSASAPRLALGMDTAQARRILGDPDGEHAARWDYGPSWVEFRCGRVAGWYSSPRRPLRVKEDTAAASAEHSPAPC